MLQLISDRISADIESPDVGLTWQEQIRQYAENYRKALLSYRDAVQIFTDTMPFTFNRLRQIEGVYRVFVNAGFSYEETTLIGTLFNNYVIGFVKEEVRFKNSTQGQETEEIIAGVRNTFKNLPATEFPTLIQLADYATVVDMDRQFDFGLDILIKGLNTILDSHA
ncbi:TetR/AcrR family transcriptional regulator C-terminal domain-containing protein [Alicyclobacillus acidoterrestris]|uniref:TetR/AcrR family transcriptional regulator C-terminal domain-containing protein n=1 Tax=Alicyclobacillus acidoterrestris (strain ATCC 49025 / DSM 3922 / CIP 106132 / NCIMB 13137 / GD3B) TaxID=1356854 RepID=T0CGN6_ALIAG|nr:TetR/AcrR family transcriptional regulator C-terminal domain-containing protein [Alicyclobacillus acidoterrestris]EPZ51650.1 hypothetical protein N007_20675 [Alicyclobacillus acidoterrestris ATCC 49025]UNO49619.1 TetR/AcrR family transcriptional regulator C-terminal domain-containing protein [Alicyclobacillus acidoterrestris]